MRTRSRLGTLGAVVGLMVVSCGGAGSADLSLASSSLGEFLVDGDGRTLYVFLNDDQTGESVCIDECEDTWPPLTEEVTAGTGINGSLLGAGVRTDGIGQVTYNGWPLYRFSGDSEAGTTNGQGIGQVWYVVDSAGNPIGATGYQPRG
ncbi:MAG: hypothetical protein ACE5MI_10575 [Acidimicrobiia bacterium]